MSTCDEQVATFRAEKWSQCRSVKNCSSSNGHLRLQKRVIPHKIPNFTAEINSLLQKTVLVSKANFSKKDMAALSDRSLAARWLLSAIQPASLPIFDWLRVRQRHILPRWQLTLSFKTALQKPPSDVTVTMSIFLYSLWEKHKKFWHARLFIGVLWGVPDATFLFFDSVTLHANSLFPMSTIWPDAGYLSAMKILCQNQGEFVYSDPWH